MAKRHSIDQLYDPRNGDLPIRLSPWTITRRQSIEPPRTNYFQVYWVESGNGTFWTDNSEHAFRPDALLFVVPYQHLRFVAAQAVRGQWIQFHANFLCVETFHAEVGCSGTLFNDPYGIPMVMLDPSAREEVTHLIERMNREQTERGLASNEVMLAYLKVLLILAARQKSPDSVDCQPTAIDPRHPILGPLKNLIEENYHSLHAPADYARLLHMTPKTLGRVVREHLGQTLTDLIQARILTHAKWELLHTLKPVKEIARSLGFRDELYFSRRFKQATGFSPTFFREFETAIRGGSNLSISSVHSPILISAPVVDDERIGT